MTKFIKINQSLINVDRIVFTSADERINEYNQSRYWLMRIKLSDGSVLEYARADTVEEMKRLNFELYEELKRLTTNE